MSWSYSGNPANSDLDLIRFMVGDTNSIDPELQDEEIQFEIDRSTSSGYFSPLKTSISVLRRVMAKYKQLVDEKVGDVSVKWSQRYKQIQSTLRDLELEHAKTSLGSAYAGGISQADKDVANNSTDRVPPAFTKNFGSGGDVNEFRSPSTYLPG